MPRKNKITIGWALAGRKSLNVDFGLFAAHKKNQIKVDADLWLDYVKAREKFEVLHAKLVEKIK